MSNYSFKGSCAHHVQVPCSEKSYQLFTVQASLHWLLMKYTSRTDPSRIPITPNRSYAVYNDNCARYVIEIPVTHDQFFMTKVKVPLNKKSP